MGKEGRCLMITLLWRQMGHITARERSHCISGFRLWMRQGAELQRSWAVQHCANAHWLPFISAIIWESLPVPLTWLHC